MKTKFRELVLGFIFICCLSNSYSAPAPGDVFQEYLYIPGGNGLWVGGQHDYGGGNVDFTGSVDLTDAIKAEVMVEKILIHDETRGLSIAINDNEWILVPLADSIPDPQWAWQHHYYPLAPIPLTQLKSGTNSFKMIVDETQGWWAQNILNGIHLRVYYDPAKKTHPTGAITSIKSGDAIGMTAAISVDALSPNSVISRVDFLGLYEGLNFEGDGVYRQWHYNYFFGEIKNHLGSVTATPYTLNWNTEWIPDQSKPFSLAARITDNNGVIYITEEINNLTFNRPDYFVELAMPFDQPKKWVTRDGDKQEKLVIKGDLSKATAAQLAWTSWSPGYMRGLFVNDVEVFQSEGPHYATFYHTITIDDVSSLKNDTNILEFGYCCPGEHGMEVQWPGIMVLMQYKGPGVIIGAKKQVQPSAPHVLKPKLFGNSHFEIEVLEKGNYSLSITNVNGAKIFSTEHNGPYTFAFSKTNFGHGVYIVQLKTPDYFIKRKVVLSY